MIAAAKNLAGSVFDLFFPPICSICGAPLSFGDDTICLGCRDSFSPIGPVTCPACGRPAEKARATRCGGCRGERFYFQRARAAFHYRDRLSDAVQCFKYNHRHELGSTLARTMFMRMEQDGKNEPRPDLLIPVPMHYLRRLHRGYNHSAILAEEYGKLAKVPCESDLLVRIRRTPRQALLPPAERARNVLGAFEAPYPDRLRGRTVGLVDDVLTSGNTVNECARMLIAAGAAEVHVIALARA